MTKQEKKIIWKTYRRVAQNYLELQRIYEEYLESENPRFPFTPQTLQRALGEYTVMLSLVRKLGFEPIDVYRELE